MCVIPFSFLMLPQGREKRIFLYFSFFPFFVWEILVCDARSQPPKSRRKKRRKAGKKDYYYATHCTHSSRSPSLSFSSLLSLSAAGGRVWVQSSVGRGRKRTTGERERRRKSRKRNKDKTEKERRKEEEKSPLRNIAVSYFSFFFSGKASVVCVSPSSP